MKDVVSAVKPENDVSLDEGIEKQQDSQMQQCIDGIGIERKGWNTTVLLITDTED